MSNNNQFDAADPTLPANLPPDLQRIDAHLKHDGRLWQAHLPSDDRLAQQARTLGYNNIPTITQTRLSMNLPQRRRLSVRALVAVSSAAVVVGLLAAIFLVLAPNRGQQTRPIAAKTATPTTTTEPTNTPTPNSGSWHTAMNWPTPSTEMAFSQSTPQTGYLCTHPTQVPKTSSQWLYKTTDGGMTWQPVAGITTPSVSVPVSIQCSIFVDANDGNDVFAQLLLMPTTGPTGEEPPASETLWRSHDGGATWQQLSIPQQFAGWRGWVNIVVIGTRIIAIGTDAQQVPDFCTPPPSPESPHQMDRLYASDDGGMTWKTIGQSIVAQGSSIGGYPNVLVSAGHTLFVETWCVTSLVQTATNHQAYWSSTDGGTSWKQVSFPDGEINNLAFTRATSGSYYGVAVVNPQIATSEPNSLMALYSSDSGVTWKSLPSLSNLPGVPGKQKYASVQEIIALPDGSVLAEIIAGSGPNSTISEIFVTHPLDATPTWRPYAPSKGDQWEIASTLQGLVLWGWINGESPSVYLSPVP